MVYNAYSAYISLMHKFGTVWDYGGGRTSSTVQLYSARTGRVHAVAFQKDMILHCVPWMSALGCQGGQICLCALRQREPTPLIAHLVAAIRTSSCVNQRAGEYDKTRYLS